MTDYGFVIGWPAPQRIRTHVVTKEVEALIGGEERSGHRKDDCRSLSCSRPGDGRRRPSGVRPRTGRAYWRLAAPAIVAGITAPVASWKIVPRLSVANER